MKKFRDYFWILPSGLLVGSFLSLLDGGKWWIGFLSYSVLLLLGLWIVSILWRRAAASRSLATVVLLSIFLRLGLGIGFTYVLPAYGYDNGIHNEGYIFRDALNRDTQAWEMAESGDALWKAFDKSYATDQYGGMLFLNAAIYRFLSPDFHRPWLVILLGALVAGIGVALAFMAVHNVWYSKLAWLVVGIVAFYPEAILLGSQQMREPFLITFLAMFLFGLVSWQGNRRASIGWLAGGVIGMLLFNPGVAIFAIVLVFCWYWLWRGRRISWRAGLLTIGALICGIILLWLGLARGGLQGQSLLDILTRWLGYSSSWDLYITQRASDGLQPLFDALPKFLHLPLVTIYGLFQPVLPGAIFDVAPWPVQTLGILRALGWYAILPLLVFSLFITTGESRQSKRAWIWLWFGTWAWILLSSFRAGGDQWDNPRYRVILILFQAILAAGAWSNWRTSRNPWMGRILIIEGVFLAVFSYWYAGRYTNWGIPHLSFPAVVMAILVISFLVLLGGWLMDRHHKRRA